MDTSRRHALSVNRALLVERMICNSHLVNELENNGCITPPQREHLINIKRLHERNDRLVDLLTRRSVASFKSFVKVLSNEQAKLVPLVMDGG